MRNSRGFAITKISLKNNVHSSSMIMNLINDLIVQQTIISISRHRAGTEPAQSRHSFTPTSAVYLRLGHSHH